MLSIASVGAAQSHYYLHAVQSETYLETAPGEPQGQWLGQGAERLGLAETSVTNADFSALFSGYRPNREVESYSPNLVQNAGADDRRAGWDLCLSLPKSASVLWSLSPPETRAEIEAAHRAGVSETLSYLEVAAARTRKGHGGTHLEPVGLVAASFEHGSSREHDPQLHTHLLVLNVGIAEDGASGAIHSRLLYDHKMAAGALYRAEVARQLEDRLGLECMPSGRGAGFEIAGVPPQVCDAFSTRRQQVEERLRERGDNGARAAEVAALDTRTKKTPLSREELFQKCRERGNELSFGNREVQTLLQTAREPFRITLPILRRTDAADTLFRHAVEAYGAAGGSECSKTAWLLTERSHFTERDLVRALAEDALIYRGGAEAVRSATQRYIASPDIVDLGLDSRQEQRYGHQKTLAVEKDLMRIAEGLSTDRRGYRVRDGILAMGIADSERRLTQERQATNDPWGLRRPETLSLSVEQKKAVRYLTQHSGALAIVTGVAGSGKTRLLDAARSAWEASGYKVEGVTASALTARTLANESEISAASITGRLRASEASFGTVWRHHGHQLWRAMLNKPTYTMDTFSPSTRTVLVVDEAQLLGTRTMHYLLQAAEAVGAKVVLVGDVRQLPALDRGAPFRLLSEQFGQAELRRVQRQELDRSDPSPTWRRDAVAALAGGDVASGLAQYATRGRITFCGGTEKVEQALLSHWVTRAKGEPEKHRILTGTTAEADRMNELAQKARRDAGRLGWRCARLRGGLWVYEKDRILIGLRSKNGKVEAGDAATIRRIDHWNRVMHVRLERTQKTVVLPFRYPGIELGYAYAARRAQGQTVENAYVLLGAKQNQETFYSQVSLARRDTFVFAPEVPGDAALPALAERISRSQAKDAALDLSSEGSGLQPSRKLPADVVRRALRYKLQDAERDVAGRAARSVQEQEHSR